MNLRELVCSKLFSADDCVAILGNSSVKLILEFGEFALLITMLMLILWMFNWVNERLG